MRIDLIVPPGSPLFFPSMACSGFKAVLSKEHDVRIHYLNMEFYAFFTATPLTHEVAAFATNTDFLYKDLAFGQPHSKVNVETLCRAEGLSVEDTAQLRARMDALPQLVEQLIDKYDLVASDLVGFTCIFGRFVPLAFCRALKRRRQEVRTVLGGTLVFKENGYAWIKYFEDVDCVVSGPGLISFPVYVEAVASGDEEKQNTIPGVLTKKNYDYIADVGEEITINEDPDRDYHDFLEKFREFGLDRFYKPRLLIETSRGCSYGKCTFCSHPFFYANSEVQEYSITEKKINSFFERHADCDNVQVQLIDGLVKSDVVANALSNVQRARPDQSLLLCTKASISERAVQSLARVGVKIFQPGLEAMSTRVLDLMAKGTNSFQNLRILKWCLSYGLLPSWNYLLGFPGMTRDDHRKCIDDVPHLVHLYPPSVFSGLVWERWSPYYFRASDFGLSLVPHPFWRSLPIKDEEFISKVADRYLDLDGKTSSLLAEYWVEMTTAVGIWRNKWLRSEIQQIPRLHYLTEGESTNIYDSRGEWPLSYELPLEPSLVLRACAEFPMSLSMLREKRTDAKAKLVMAASDRDVSVSARPAGKLDGMTDDALEGAIRWLDERHLLFSDEFKGETRYMSLISDKPPTDCLKLFDEQRKTSQLYI